MDLWDSLSSQTTFRSAEEADGLFPWMVIADFNLTDLAVPRFLSPSKTSRYQVSLPRPLAAVGCLFASEVL